MAELIRRKRVESASKLEKICKFCGKKFVPKSVRDAYCDGPHYKTCVVCGKQFEVNPKERRQLNETCSKECRYISAKRNTNMDQMIKTLKTTMLKRYGVENSVDIPGVREKIKNTVKDRYGVEWYTQTDEYKEHVKKTSIEKYGVEHYLASEEIKKKRSKTNLDRYGTENVFASEEIKSKIKSTLIESNVIKISNHRPFKV